MIWLHCNELIHTFFSVSTHFTVLIYSKILYLYYTILSIAYYIDYRTIASLRVNRFYLDDGSLTYVKVQCALRFNFFIHGKTFVFFSKLIHLLKISSIIKKSQSQGIVYLQYSWYILCTDFRYMWWTEHSCYYRNLGSGLELSFIFIFKLRVSTIF